MKAIGMNPYQYSGLSARGRIPLEVGLSELERREATGATGLCPRCGAGQAKWSEGDVTPSGRYRLTCQSWSHRFTKDPNTSRSARVTYLTRGETVQPPP